MLGPEVASNVYPTTAERFMELWENKVPAPPPVADNSFSFRVS